MADIDFNVTVDSQVSQTITDGVTTKAPSENAVFDALSGKQNTIGYTPEDQSNKKTTMSGNTTSNVFYLSAKAIFDWATGIFELLSNKVSTVSASATQYPNNNAIIAYAAPLASQLKATDLKNAAYTAVPGDYVPVDTTSGIVNITLPTSPADGTIIGIKRVVGATNNATYTCGGSNVLNVSGGSTSGTLSILNQQVTLIYRSTGGIWYVETSLSVGGVISVPITGFSASPGSVASSDSILQAFNKIVGNQGTLASGIISYPRRAATWYTSGVVAYATGTMAQSGNVIRLTPFFVSEATSFTDLSMEITGAGSAGSVVRLGIYSSVSNFPSLNILNAGTIAGDSNSWQSIAISITLQPGLYWLAFIHNSVTNITFRSIPFTSTIPSVLGVISGSLTGNFYNFVQMSHTYNGALPTISGASVQGNNIACIGIKTA